MSLPRPREAGESWGDVVQNARAGTMRDELLGALAPGLIDHRRSGLAPEIAADPPRPAEARAAGSNSPSGRIRAARVASAIHRQAVYPSGGPRSPSRSPGRGSVFGVRRVASTEQAQGGEELLSLRLLAGLVPVLGSEGEDGLAGCAFRRLPSVKVRSRPAVFPRTIAAEQAPAAYHGG